jgi:isopentenyldiphosphate isomerase
MSEEEVILVDEHDYVIGYKLRAELDHAVDRWRICGLLIFDGQGNCLIQQRSLAKKTDPGKWAPPVAGTLSKSEEYLNCTIRETHEEIGVVVDNLTEIYRGPIDAPNGRRYCVYYSVVLPKDTHFVLQPEEVDAVKWVNISELVDDTIKSPDKYISSTRVWRQLLLTQLKKEQTRLMT